MNNFTQSLIAGSAAGTSVDVILFPLDTIKTRLQSQGGFWKSGGFSGIYRGIGPAFLGSAPNAALFFTTYDTAKTYLGTLTKTNGHPGVHMLAASLGEVAACSIRVPVEVVKQRRQIFFGKGVSLIIRDVLKAEGFTGFYRGYFSTIFREIPFSIIQFPLWEYLKIRYRLSKGDEVTAAESSLCGAIAGGISAAVTTPLDVAKTRIMLADVTSTEAKGQILTVWKIIYAQHGVKGLFAGVLPRTLWISLGGSIFFGTYELVKSIIR